MITLRFNRKKIFFINLTQPKGNRKMDTTKTVYNPATGDDHLIDCQTGLETVPEITEEEIRNEMFDDFEGTPEDFVNEFFGRYSKEVIAKGIYNNYIAFDVAESLYDLFKDYADLKKELTKRTEQLEQSIENFNALKSAIDTGSI